MVHLENNAPTIVRKENNAYLERLLSGQLLCGGRTVLLNTIKHLGLRLEDGGEEQSVKMTETTLSHN